MPTYPVCSLSGTSRELGRQHGAFAKQQIRGYFDYLAASLKLSTAQVADRARRFLPLFERDCPQLIEEVRGLAEGAGIEFEQALALQLRGEIGCLPEGACTTFAISGRGTSSGEPLVGQTSDTPAEIVQFGYVLRIESPTALPLVMWTFGGMLGYHGLNSAGVCHFANSLGGGPKWKFALSHYPLKRLILEQNNLAEVVSLMQRIPVCSNGNYMLGDGTGAILDVELTSQGPVLLPAPGQGFLVHSNHYLCAAYARPENFVESLPDSFPRLERLQHLIAERFGSITLADVQGFLSDHDGQPVSICRHAHSGFGNAMLPATGHTVAALIAEPMQGKLHVACSNPCENPFVTYTVPG